MFTRRTILKSATAAGVAATLPSALLAQSATRVLTRVIPGTQEQLPLVGFGSSAAVDQILQTGPGLVSQILEAMVNLGGSMVDTAPRTPEVDDVFGKVLADPKLKSNLFVNTKIGRNRALNLRKLDKQAGLDQVRQMEQYFQRKPQDLILVDSMLDMDVHWSSLQDVKAAGAARYIGYTTSNTVDHEKMEGYMKSHRPDFIQVNYSLLEPEAANRILPLARDNGIAVIINTPFGGGEFFKRTAGLALPDFAAELDCTSWAQFNLKYILGEPAVSCILTETTKVANLEENLRAATGRLPDEAMRKRMKEHFDSLLKA